MKTALPTLLTACVFGESPRWHDGRLYFSDIGAQEIVAVDLNGDRELVASIPTIPSGLGWLPDGRMLVVSVRDGQLLRREPDGSVVIHADLSALSDRPWNDLVVDGRGNAYVGNMGFNFPAGEEFSPGIVALARPDGTIIQVADGVAFPNGLAVTADNSTLILAESYASKLTAFDIGDDGTLCNRRTWADLGEGVPDGICLDAAGSVWYGDPRGTCARVSHGGVLEETIDLDRACFACALGGEDGRTLFLMTAEMPDPGNPAARGPRNGQVLTLEAPAAGVGWP